MKDWNQICNSETYIQKITSFMYTTYAIVVSLHKRRSKTEKRETNWKSFYICLLSLTTNKLSRPKLIVNCRLRTSLSNYLLYRWWFLKWAPPLSNWKIDGFTFQKPGPFDQPTGAKDAVLFHQNSLAQLLC